MLIFPLCVNFQKHSELMQKKPGRLYINHKSSIYGLILINSIRQKCVMRAQSERDHDCRSLWPVVTRTTAREEIHPGVRTERQVNGAD